MMHNVGHFEAKPVLIHLCMFKSDVMRNMSHTWIAVLLQQHYSYPSYTKQLSRNVRPHFGNFGIFKEMQTVMHAVLEDHLNTNKGKAWVSQSQLNLDEQIIYCELK
jgi:hypothetical protein